MSSLGDAVYGMLTGGDPEPMGGPADLVGELLERYGSVSGAARAAGVPRRSMRDWVANIAAGKPVRPKATNAARLAQGVRRARIAPGGLSDAGVRLNTRDRDSERERTLTAQNLRLRPGTMDRVAQVWITTGDKEKAGAEFLAGVGDPWYRNYLRPRGADREQETSRGGHAGDDEDDDEFGDEDDDEEFDEWPYDDLVYEDTFGEFDEGYGGEVA